MKIEHPLSRPILLRKNITKATFSVDSRYSLYECRKRQWDIDHPNATSRGRDAAMIKIARECGV